MTVKNISARVLYIATDKGTFTIVPTQSLEIAGIEKDVIVLALIKDKQLEKVATPKGK